MLNTANNVQNSPSFKGYLNSALRNPPFPEPKSRREYDQNLLTIGTGSGMDIAITLKTLANSVLLAGGAAAGALMPKKTLDAVNLLISGKKEPLIKEGEEILGKTRGKAALIGALVTVGAVNAAGVAVRAVKSLLFPDRTEQIRYPQLAPRERINISERIDISKRITISQRSDISEQNDIKD